MARKLQSSGGLHAVCVAIAMSCCATVSAAPVVDPPKKPKAPPAALTKDHADADLDKFCGLAAPAAQEARIAWQMRQLNELDAKLKDRMADIDKAATAARDWVSRREAMRKKATDEVVAIVAKMQPEPAAAQLAELDDTLAASILGKLKPGTAGAILGEMEAPRASKLTWILSGGSPSAETP